MNKVISKDGTPIAYNVTGTGPSVILIDGAFCSKDFGPMTKLAPVLAKKFRVVTYDRRARGQSGDTKPYSIEREIDDIRALLHMVGGSAFLFGISSGAILAFKAVASGLNIIGLAVLEPPYVGNEKGKRPSDGFEQLSALIDEDKRGKAARFYLRRIMGVPALVVFIMQFTLNWPKMKANAASLPYDVAICGNFDVDKSELNKVGIPTLLIASTKSPKILRAAVYKVQAILKHAKTLELMGTNHGVPPKVLVPVLEHFFLNNEKTTQSRKSEART